MPVPVFVIHELILEIYALDAKTGSYISHSYNSTGAIVLTTTRKIKIRNAILNRQFKDPRKVLRSDLLHLANSYYT